MGIIFRGHNDETTNQAGLRKRSEADRERAAVLFENGSRLYDEGEYEAAILAFEESFQLSNEPALRFNIANCLERLNRLTDARKELTLYRAFAPEEEREVLERRIAALDRRIAQETPAPSPEPLPEPVVGATLPEPTTAKRAPRWPIVVSGLVVSSLGAAAIGATYGESRRFIAADDRDAFERVRILNGASWTGTGIGVGLVGIGLVLQRPLP